MLEESFSRAKINEFMLSLLDDKPFVYAHEIKIDSVDNLTKLIAGEIFAEYDDISYRLDFLPNTLDIMGFKTTDFIIYRK